MIYAVSILIFQILWLLLAYLGSSAGSTSASSTLDTAPAAYEAQRGQGVVLILAVRLQR